MWVLVPFRLLKIQLSYNFKKLLSSLTKTHVRLLPMFDAHSKYKMSLMSFLQITRVQTALQEVGFPDVGIILKIETTQAFEHLPTLLLAAMKSRKVGVMIARGDLAVEVRIHAHMTTYTYTCTHHILGAFAYLAFGRKE